MSLSGLSGALLLGAILGAFIAVSLLTEHDRRPHLASFYFEARIEVPETVDDNLLGEMKGWFEAPGRWRYEFSSPDPARVHETVVMVSDGLRYWLYRGETNTYLTGSVSEYLANFGLSATEAPPPPTFGLLLGPVPLGDVDAYLQALAEAGNATLSSRNWERTIAGRRADRVDLQGQDGHTFSVWVDQEYDFVLRFETQYASSSPAGEEPGTLEGEVQAVQFNADIDDAVFAFEPPPGAREEPPDDGTASGSGSSGSLGEGIPPPEGFLAVGDVPEGYEAVSFESSGGSQGMTSYGVTYEPPDGSGMLRVEQTLRAGGLADSQRIGEPVQVGDITGYLTGDGPALILTWAQGDLVIRMTAIGPTGDEMLRIAESMRP
jgi:outer membrane lipoprotein-sorting protein